MPLLALGINHKTAPVAVREQVAFGAGQLEEALRTLKACGLAEEAAILSTCNRTELYCIVVGAGNEHLLAWLAQHHGIPAATLEAYAYHYSDRLAVRHLLRVATGLDSLVLGEPQILGQVKAAYQAASRAGSAGIVLNRLFQHTFTVAKRVRTDTRIGASPVSVAFAAVSLARQIFANLADYTALLIGAGDTIELVARHLCENRIGRLVVANRTLEHAHDLAAAMQGYAISLDELPAHLAEADIIIAAAASPTFLLAQAQVRSSLKLRRHRPVLMVDIAVPRNIDPAAGELEDVYLYTVDDLQQIIEENLRSRRAAAQQAEEIIDTQINHFMAWLRALDSAGSIRALRQRAERVRDEVVENARRQLRGGKEPAEVLQYLANTLTNKLIHAPSVALREAGSEQQPALVNALRMLYKLDDG